MECLSQMLEKQPADPRKFVREHLEKVRNGSFEAQFTVEDLDTMFDMFDLMQVGKISTSKVDEAVQLLRPEGLRPNESPPALPSATEEDNMVTKTQFVTALGPLLT